MERLLREDYIPDEQDVLRSRVQTTGIIETSFRVKQLIYRSVCMCVCVCHCQLLSSQSGGCRRSEVREKKVDPMFRRCPCGSLCLCSQWVRHDPLRGRKNGGCGLLVMWVWFECCVSIQNRLEESLNLFQAICNNKFFVKTAMVCVCVCCCCCVFIAAVLL